VATSNLNNNNNVAQSQSSNLSSEGLNSTAIVVLTVTTVLVLLAVLYLLSREHGCSFQKAKVRAAAVVPYCVVTRGGAPEGEAITAAHCSQCLSRHLQLIMWSLQRPSLLLCPPPVPVARAQGW
jgi:hypothetical protein